MIQQTTVIDVEWNVSKSGFLKPIVKVTPIVLCGALVSATSGYNARFIVDNKIGKNAVISITRSGEVIPKIVDVIKPTDNEIILPENCEWNSTNVELKILEKDNNDMKAKELVHFAKVLNIKCIGESTASKLVENGIDTPLKLLQCKEVDFGLSSSLMSTKIYNNIQKAWKEANLEQKMHASGYFNNLGVSTFRLIMDNTKDFSSIDDIVKIQGIGPIMAKSFVDGYPNFYKFHSTIEPEFYTKNVVAVTHPTTRLQGKVYCYSGFREYKVPYNGDMISINEVITKNGGIVVNGMSKKVSCLIVAGDDITKKVEDANKYNIKIINIQQLISSKDLFGEL
jgi:NAD-dependent DNA ligase